jgi:hypothetical protein
MLKIINFNVDIFENILIFIKNYNMMNNLNNNLPSFSKALSLLVIFVIILALLFSGLFVSVAILAALIVPLTWIWGVLTGQSYDRVCDNSEIVYRLNQLGKWTLVIGAAIGLITILFGLFF